MKFKLRDYQEEAINSAYDYLSTHDDNPCIVIPTGGGKTPILAQICNDMVNLWKGRILIVAHVKELLEQAVTHLSALLDDTQVGVYSAGLNRRNTKNSVIVGGVQSIYKRPEELGRFEAVIVDEAHRIPVDGEGMYRTLISGLKEINPHIRVIGLTATPYRMKSGMICEPENILNKICYEVSVKKLMDDGWLCPVSTKAGSGEVNTSGLHIRAGEFIQSETEELMNTRGVVGKACADIAKRTRSRRSVLVFCCSVDHAFNVFERLRYAGSTDVITGETKPKERSEIIQRFKDGELKYLVNVNVLTLGFDAPNIDCVVLLRPTASPGLYLQMVGRGFRIHDDKENCLILDYGNNVSRHGPIDSIKLRDKKSESRKENLAKKCFKCDELVGVQCKVCTCCGFEFPPPKCKKIKPKHRTKATYKEIISGVVSIERYQVVGIKYSVHSKRGAPGSSSRSMKVTYTTREHKTITEWVCIEHKGYARRKASKWWILRTRIPYPRSAYKAVEIAKQGGLREPVEIVVKSVSGERFDRITECSFLSREKPGTTQKPKPDRAQKMQPCLEGFDFHGLF